MRSRARKEERQLTFEIGRFFDIHKLSVSVLSASEEIVLTSEWRELMRERSGRATGADQIEKESKLY